MVYKSLLAAVKYRNHLGSTYRKASLKLFELTETDICIRLQLISKKHFLKGTRVTFFCKTCLALS